MNEEDIVKKVFLLAIYKQEADETLMDTLKALVNTGMFDIKEGKEVLKMLQEEKFIVGDKLSFKGITLAQKAEAEFKIG